MYHEGLFHDSVKRVPNKEVQGILGWLTDDFESSSTHAHKHCWPRAENSNHCLLTALVCRGKFEHNKQVMPKAYAVDLWWRVVWLYLAHNCSSSEISNLLLLFERSVRRYISLFHQTDMAHRSYLGDFGQLTLLHIILSNPGIYLSEIKDYVTHLLFAYYHLLLLIFSVISPDSATVLLSGGSFVQDWDCWNSCWPVSKDIAHLLKEFASLFVLALFRFLVLFLIPAASMQKLFLHDFHQRF